MIKRLSYLLLSSFLALSFAWGGKAHAASTVSFEGGAENFVFSPSNDLFDNLKDLAPGDSHTEQITVKNLATDYDYVKIYLRAEPSTENSLLSQLTLNVYQDAKLLSSAPASDSAGLTENVLLGTFEPETETLLTVELSAPLTLGNAYQRTSGEIAWIFTAEAYKDGQIVPPNTGAATVDKAAANTEIVTAATLALVFSMILTLIILSRKKAKTEK